MTRIAQTLFALFVAVALGFGATQAVAEARSEDCGSGGAAVCNTDEDCSDYCLTTWGSDAYAWCNDGCCECDPLSPH